MSLGGIMTQATARQPIVFLEMDKMLPRRLDQGELGVVLARAGVGKTPVLVQLLIDALLSGNDVVHIACGHTLQHVQASYDALLAERMQDLRQSQRDELRTKLLRQRTIRILQANELDPKHLEQVLAAACTHLGLNPQIVLIDDFNWNESTSRLSSTLSEFKAIAKQHHCSLWMSAKTHRDETGDHPSDLPPPVRDVAQRIDLAIFLDPQDDTICMRPLLAYGAKPQADQQVFVNAKTFLPLVSDRDAKLVAADHTLLSGAAKGAEECFGRCAERWGLEEHNLSFAGRQTARERGLMLLSPEELKQGDVSYRYISSRMGRVFPDTHEFRKVLQTIWHQVAKAGEVFAIGLIQPAGTVKGGTGWAVELAKHLHKPVCVFDQEQDAWFSWDSTHWRQIEPPAIKSSKFVGTGTRSLTSVGEKAIHDLFQRSFGPSS